MRLFRHAHEETILRLVSALRYRDEETGGHIKRTGLHCELFAEVLGWPPEGIENIRMAAPMHDLGKIGIPDAILKKPGKLTQDEFEVMKTHTIIGAQMLEGSESAVLQMARDIALCHHERWDGAGYPRGIARWAIPESARIVAIVDVFDALTHRRVYHEAAPEEQALAIMEAGPRQPLRPFPVRRVPGAGAGDPPHRRREPGRSCGRARRGTLRPARNAAGGGVGSGIACGRPRRVRLNGGTRHPVRAESRGGKTGDMPRLAWPWHGHLPKSRISGIITRECRFLAQVYGKCRRW